MLFFVVLAGVTNTAPLNKTYFLRADTGGITGSRDVSQWTFFHICGPNNEDCDKAKPALPFGAAWDGNAQNVPDGLSGWVMCFRDVVGLC
jgi:hypothetical protein